VRDRLSEVLSPEDRREIDLGFSLFFDLFSSLGACNFAFLWFLRTAGLTDKLCISFDSVGLERERWERLCLRLARLEGWQLCAIAYRVERPLCLCKPEEIEALIPQEEDLESYINTLNERHLLQWAKFVLTLNKKVEEVCRENEREDEKAWPLPGQRKAIQEGRGA